MANLLKELFGKGTEVEVSRYNLNDYYRDLSLNPYGFARSGPYDDREVIENDFCSYANQIYKRSGVVYATMEVRRSNFSQIRFQWQNMNPTSPKFMGLFGDPELNLLEIPWPNGSTADLLSRMEQDVSLSGNAYIAREGNRLRRLQPDWVVPVLSAPHAEAVQSDVVGYVYTPGGYNSGGPEAYYLVEDIAHWAPVPNPTYQYIGMSWLQTILMEIQADRAAGEHKLNFFRNGATLQTVVTPKEGTTLQQFKEFMEVTNASHVGTHNAYKPLYLGYPADVRVMGADIQQMDFHSTQGRDETRIALAGRVPAVILGISEGLQGSSLNAGNFASARRNFVDGFLWSHWGSVCTALQSILTVPDASRLWFETKDVPLLREDKKDEAEIRQIQSTSMRTLIDAGFVPETVVSYVHSGDPNVLQHSELFSVQLQPPTTAQVNPNDAARTVRVNSIRTLHELMSSGWTPVIDGEVVNDG